MGLAIAGAFVYGFVTSHTDSPVDASAFWIANLAAPYLLIPFVAGAWFSRAAVASLAGALAGAAAIAGFYNVLGVGDVTNAQLGLPPTASARSVLLHAYQDWVRTLVLGGPGGRPWLTVAVAAGAVAGYLGYRWRRQGSRLAATAVVSALVLEPLVHLAGLHVPPVAPNYDFTRENVAVWAAEALVGVLALAWVWVGAQRPGRPVGPGLTDSYRG